MTTIPVVDESILVALIRDLTTATHAWADRAACIELHDAGALYFPDDDGVPSGEALDCCARCPVAQLCLVTALVHEATDGCRFGWWGGLGPSEREVLWATLDPILQPKEVDRSDPISVARHLRAQRRTVPSIAAELGCTERTVYRYLAASAA